jgi:hypothetical protein
MKRRIDFGRVAAYLASLIFWLIVVLLFVRVGAGQPSGLILPRADVIFLDAENGLWRQRACAGFCRREITVSGLSGQLIGIDYRPSDGLLYGLDDTGRLYTIDARGAATQVSTLTLPFGGDVRSLMDFNPVVDALRLIGANDQNYAVVNANGNLNLTVAQTSLRYADGDVNAGRNPNVVGGAYANNVAGAATTLFYGIDYDLDALVTIAPPLVGAGSSNTGGGQLQTIGRLVDWTGRRFDLDATADVDIYTFGGANRLIGVSGGKIFSIEIDKLQVPPTGQTQRVFARWIPLGVHAQFIDVAVGPPRAACDY